MAKAKTFPQAWALEVQEDIFAWLGTPIGYLEVLTHYANMFKKTLGGDNYPDTEVVQHVTSWMPSIMKNELDAIHNPVPTFCTADYTSMLHTMASAAPLGSLRIADISQPEGLLVLEVPITIELPGDAPDIERVRAFSWYTDPGEPGSNTLAVYTRAWTETKRTPETPKILSRHKLFPAPLALTVLGRVTEEEADHAYNRLLLAHLALLRSPLAEEQPVERNTRVTPRTKRSLGDSVRRIYLRRPEVACFEADEAAAAREGRAPMRAHWVRGHWRNQPYPKSGENRWLWIEGYIKGNADLGTVTSRKVGVARAAASELRALVPAT